MEIIPNKYIYLSLNFSKQYLAKTTLCPSKCQFVSFSAI